MLTEEQKRAREFKTTASQVPILMSGNCEKINRLWCERIGQAEPEDLSQVWPVQLGSFLENFILDWHQNKIGKTLSMRGLFCQHPTLRYVGATIDGFCADENKLIEVKVLNGWQRSDDYVRYYAGQVLTAMRCIPCEYGSLLVCHGGAEPTEFPILLPDADFEREMWARIASFQLCCESLTPPSPLPVAVPPDKWRSIDLDNTAEPWPNWAHEVAFHLEQWRELRPMAAEFEDTAGRIKSLIPDDVGRLAYAAMTVNRNRRGAITIKSSAA